MAESGLSAGVLLVRACLKFYGRPEHHSRHNARGTADPPYISI